MSSDDIMSIAEFIASEVGFYSPGMVVQAEDLIAWLAKRGFAVVAADEIERLRAAGDALAEALAWWGKGNEWGDAARVAWQEARREQ